ncbi:MAG TPA: DUF992 domain-containing protein [Acetobacteraceae bacterium]|nr:DUF992 domain-containing protein [Acetobacteraceae bacterium]
MLRKSLLSGVGIAFAIGTLALGNPASAAARVKVGVLTCQVASGWGFIFGSSRRLRCTYSGSGRTDHYIGAIKQFGVDIGYVQSGVIVWGVFSPTTDLGAGALSGDYGGATADASLGIGGGANVLVGGSTKSISLQPLSVEGEKGLNVAAGIAAISLKTAP